MKPSSCSQKPRQYVIDCRSDDDDAVYRLTRLGCAKIPDFRLAGPKQSISNVIVDFLFFFRNKLRTYSCTFGKGIVYGTQASCRRDCREM